MKKILIMAGGTGGHVFPGLAVAKELAKNNEYDVLWLGTKSRMEAKLVPEHGFEIAFIDIQGVRRNGLVRKLCAPFKIIVAICQAIGVIRRFKPNVVLGMGGFASGPGGVAAKLLGIPLVLHEQNAAPGLTNRLLAKIANKILLGFPNAFTGKKVQVVGNPVRADVVALHDTPKTFSSETEALRILVIGGSLGAEILNKTVPQALRLVTDQNLKIAITHQCGANNSAKVQELYQDFSTKLASCTVSDFISDMASAYQQHDLIICRAGALTVAEVTASGMPAIFVPLPTAVDDHQTKNAQTLVDIQAAKLLPQAQLTAESLAKMISELATNRQLLIQMSTQAKSVARLNATIDVANVCRQLAK